MDIQHRMLNLFSRGRWSLFIDGGAEAGSSNFRLPQQISIWMNDVEGVVGEYAFTRGTRPPATTPSIRSGQAPCAAEEGRVRGVVQQGRVRVLLAGTLARWTRSSRNSPGGWRACGVSTARRLFS